MTNEEILKKAIEKAVENGYRIPEYPAFRENYPIDYFIAVDVKSYYIDIFSHSFAKCFWGDEIYAVNYGKKAETLYYWQRHLQQMVLEEEPLKYLEKFLEEKMNKGEKDVSEFEREWINFLVPILNNQGDEVMNARIRKILDKVEKWHKSERKKWALELLQTIIEEGDCLPDGLVLEIVTQIREKIEEG